SKKDKDFALFISDLEKRYNIKVLLVKDSDEIEEILRTIKDKIISKNIFISGRLDNLKYEAEAYEILKEICEKLIDSYYNIVTGMRKNNRYLVYELCYV